LEPAGEGTKVKPPALTGRISTVLLWVAIGAAYLYPQFLFDIHNPNERVRIYMTAAMVEEGSFVIGTRTPRERGRGFIDKGIVYERWGYVNDKALVCDDPELKPPDCAGPLYSAKAPGSSFLGYPFYAALYGITKASTGEAPSMETIILVLRLFTVIIPTLFMLVAFRRFATINGYDPVLSDLLTIAIALGSMVYTYSHMFAGHQISAYFLFFGFLAAWKIEQSDKLLWPVLSGVCAGMAVIVEYPMALVSLVLFAYALRNRFTLKNCLAFCGGGALPAILAGWFHWSAFGGPHKTAYATLENTQFVKDIAPGFMGLRQPKLENLFGAFVSPFEGLFFFAPWMVLMVITPITYYVRHFRRDSGPFRASFATCSAAVFVLVAFISCHSLWRGGWTLGPRYIVPIVPFAGLLVLHGTDRLATHTCRLSTRLIVTILVLLSVLVTGSCSLVSQGFHTAFFNPLVEATIPLLQKGFVTVNLGHLFGLEGGASAVPLLLLVAPGLGLLLWQATAGCRATTAIHIRVFLMALVLLATVAGLKGLTTPEKPMTLRKWKALTWAQDNFYPYESITNDTLRTKEHLKFAARYFPGQSSIQALQMSALTLEGSCKQSLTVAGRYERASRVRPSYDAFAHALMLAQPFPTGLPVPLLLRPDFDIPIHLWRKLSVADEE
jgi:hypothetical protein